MISFTDAQMEQERNDPKWLMVNGNDPEIRGSLFLDTMPNNRSLNSVMSSAVVADMVNWYHVRSYRLHNGPGYKDGIAIEPCKITQMKEQKAGGWADGLPPVGEVCEQEIIPGKWVPATVLFRNDSGCIVDTPYRTMGDNLRRTGPQSYYSKLVDLHFRPTQTNKEKDLEAAEDVVKSALTYIQKKRGTQNQIQRQLICQTVWDLSDANMLVLPEGDK